MFLKRSAKVNGATEDPFTEKRMAIEAVTSANEVEPEATKER